MIMDVFLLPCFLIVIYNKLLIFPLNFCCPMTILRCSGARAGARVGAGAGAEAGAGARAGVGAGAEVGTGKTPV